MKISILIATVLMLIPSDLGNRLLSRLNYYQAESYFKNKVYAENNTEQFYSLKEPNQTINPANYDFHLICASLFYATNKMRQSNKINPLKFSNELRNAATIHTNEMITKDFFDHFNNKGSKEIRTPEQRILLFCKTKNPGATAENCDRNFMPTYKQFTYIELAEQIVNDLYKSAPHRKNMLDKSFQYFGCAVLFEQTPSSNEVVYLKSTQNFAANIY